MKIGEAEVEFPVKRGSGLGYESHTIGRMTTRLRLQLGREYSQEELCRLVEVENRVRMEAEHADRKIYAADVRPLGDHSEVPGSICLEAAPAAV